MSQVKASVAEGGCQCGKVRYAFYAPLENAHACHCRMCQRAVGGAFALLVGGAKANFAWTKGEPGVFASSNLATRAYCRDCGTPLSFSYNREDARFYVTIGSLDDPDAAPIGKQYGVESKLAWVSFCENVEGARTGGTAEMDAFYAAMQSNQG